MPGSNLIYTGSSAGDSESQVILSALLMDDLSAPIEGRTVEFTLSGVNGVLGTTGTTDPGGAITQRIPDLFKRRDA